MVSAGSQSWGGDWGRGVGHGHEKIEPEGDTGLRVSTPGDHMTPGGASEREDLPRKINQVN